MENTKGTAMIFQNLKKEEVEATEVYVRLSQIEHVMHALLEIHSAHASLSKSSIQKNWYRCRRSLGSVSLPGTVVKRAHLGKPQQRAVLPGMF